MAAKLAPIVNNQWELADGTPAVGNQFFFYAAGSVNTKQNVYTDAGGGTALANPVVLNALGLPPSGGVWLTEGSSYKIVYAPANDTDPPTSPIDTWDDIVGVGDATLTVDQWAASGLTPTFVGATSFTLVGDQTTDFHVGRRLKTTNSGGTIYSTISASVFGALTTVTVINDSGVLDAGLSAVSYGLMTADNTSWPRIATAGTGITITWANGKPTVAATVLQGFINGCTLSNNVADATNDIDIAAGACADSTNVVYIAVAAMTKRLDAGWVAGTGQGFRNSAVAITDTTYHIYAVATATGTQDYYAHTSTTVATVIAALQAEAGGASYIYARRIGSIIRSGATILGFSQLGDEFLLKTPVNDLNVSGAMNTATSRVLTVPLGIKVRALASYAMFNSVGTVSQVLLYSPDQTDTVCSVTNCDLRVFAANGLGSISYKPIRTDTSAQIRTDGNATDANSAFINTTFGWMDTRGKE